MKRSLFAVLFFFMLGSNVFSMEDKDVKTAASPSDQSSQEDSDTFSLQDSQEEQVLDGEQAAILIQKVYRGYADKKHFTNSFLQEGLSSLLNDFLAGKVSDNKFFSQLKDLPKNLKPFLIADIFEIFLNNFKIKEKFDDNSKKDLGSLINALLSIEQLSIFNDKYVVLKLKADIAGGLSDLALTEKFKTSLMLSKNLALITKASGGVLPEAQKLVFLMTYISLIESIKDISRSCFSDKTKEFFTSMVEAMQKSFNPQRS